MNEKLNSLLQDKAFLEKLLALETETDVQALLAENGVELTIAEIAAIKSGIEAKLGENEELSEDDLENVSGGSVAAIITAVATGLVALGTAVDQWTNRRW